MKDPILLEMLLNSNEISQKQMKRVLSIYRKKHRPVGLILIEEGYLTEETLARYLSMEYQSLVRPYIS